MNRAEIAIQLLETAKNHSLHSYELANLMKKNCNFAPRAINEAQKILKPLGLKIKSVPEQWGRTRGTRYTLVSLTNEPVLYVKPEVRNPKKYVFDAIRKVYVETTEYIVPRTVAVQGSFL